MCKIINTDMEWVADPPNTVVVQIGDQLDSQVRDTEPGWEKLEDLKLIRFTDKLDAIAKEKGGRFISLLGNHEIMNVTANFTYVSSHSLEKSGGYLGRMNKLKPGGEYAKLLAKRPVVLNIGELLFCHAGLLPHHLDLVGGDISVMNKLCSTVLLGHPVSKDLERLFHDLFMDASSLLWNRDYLEGTKEGELMNVLQRCGCNSMVIGHNPIEHITPLYGGRLWITDVGLSRAFSHTSLEVLEIRNGREFRTIYAVKK
jgi:hypothetical protein